jgi:hypothetical protein
MALDGASGGRIDRAAEADADGADVVRGDQAISRFGQLATNGFGAALCVGRKALHGRGRFSVAASDAQL